MTDILLNVLSVTVMAVQLPLIGFLGHKRHRGFDLQTQELSINPRKKKPRGSGAFPIAFYPKEVDNCRREAIAL